MLLQTTADEYATERCRVGDWMADLCFKPRSARLTPSREPSEAYSSAVVCKSLFCLIPCLLFCLVVMLHLLFDSASYFVLKYYFAISKYINNFASTKLSNTFVGHHCLT